MKEAIKSEEIQVGQLLQVHEGEEFPCDIVLLSSSSPFGDCFIQTTNLDGESDYKPRRSLTSTWRLTPAILSSLRGVLECESPNPHIYSFTSRLRIETFPSSTTFVDLDREFAFPLPSVEPWTSNDTEKILRTGYSSVDSDDEINDALIYTDGFNRTLARKSDTSSSDSENDNDLPTDRDGYLPLDASNLALQATILRNTEWVIGLVVYTGDDTKFGRNKTPAPTKAAKIDGVIDRVYPYRFFSEFTLDDDWSLRIASSVRDWAWCWRALLEC